MLNFNFSEKGLRLVFRKGSGTPPQFVYDFKKNASHVTFN